MFQEKFFYFRHKKTPKVSSSAHWYRPFSVNAVGTFRLLSYLEVKIFDFKVAASTFYKTKICSTQIGISKNGISNISG